MNEDGKGIERNLSYIYGKAWVLLLKIAYILLFYIYNIRDAIYDIRRKEKHSRKNINHSQIRNVVFHACFCIDEEKIGRGRNK